jgi:hypothetical protein
MIIPTFHPTAHPLRMVAAGRAFGLTRINAFPYTLITPCHLMICGLVHHLHGPVTDRAMSSHPATFPSARELRRKRRMLSLRLLDFSATRKHALIGG